MVDDNVVARRVDDSRLIDEEHVILDVALESENVPEHTHMHTNTHRYNHKQSALMLMYAVHITFKTCDGKNKRHICRFVEKCEPNNS